MWSHKALRWSRKAPNRYHSLNGANDLGRNPYSSCRFGLSQSEAFLPLSPGCSDIAHEHDVILPLKGKCVCALEALLSGTWLLVSALETVCSVVDRKVGLFLRDIAATSMVRMPYALLFAYPVQVSIARVPPLPLRLRRLILVWIKAAPPPRRRHQMFSVAIRFLLKPRGHDINIVHEGYILILHLK